MPRPVLKWIVKLRMWYADLRGHHGKKWDYEPSENYMRKKKYTQNFRRSKSSNAYEDRSQPHRAGSDRHLGLLRHN